RGRPDPARVAGAAAPADPRRTRAMERRPQPRRRGWRVALRVRPRRGSGPTGRGNSQRDARDIATAGRRPPPDADDRRAEGGRRFARAASRLGARRRGAGRLGARSRSAARFGACAAGLRAGPQREGGIAMKRLGLLLLGWMLPVAAAATDKPAAVAAEKP